MQYQTLANILSTEYGVGPLIAPPEAVLWAADKMPDWQAKEELKALNRARNIYGYVPVFVPYGHRLF
jgi:hypothetical protein